MIETHARTFTLEEYMIVQDRVEVKLELLEGQIQPKEASRPLPIWVVEEILRPNYNPEILNYQFPTTSSRHARIIKNISYALIKKLDEDDYEVFSQDPQIFISLTGSYRIPDVTVAPSLEEQIFEKDSLTNPVVVIEVLSPSNGGEDFVQKIYDYKSVDSLQEYWLVRQEKQMLERYIRHDEEDWICRSFDSTHEKILFPTLDCSIDLSKIYKGVLL